MMRTLRILAALLFSTCLTLRADDRMLVESAYPDDLVGRCEADDPNCQRHTAYARLTGRPGEAGLIVATFSDGRDVMVDLLAVDAAGVSRVQRAAGPITGPAASVELLDVTGDGQQEVVITTAPMHGIHEPVWVFARVDDRLKNIGPTRRNASGKQVSLLTNALFFDLDGDGRLEAIGSPDRTARPDGSYRVDLELFTLGESGYDAGETLPYFGVFRPADPSNERETFEVAESGAYRVHITAERPVRSAMLAVDGVVLLQPSDLQSGDTSWTRDLTLAAGTHEVEATLRGERGAELEVLIRKLR